MKNLHAIVVVIIAIAVAVAVLAVKKSDSLYQTPPSVATTTEDIQNILGTDTVTVSIGERAILNGGISIEPLELVEDSRCPEGVQCIQAGRVLVRARIVSGMGTSTEVFEQDKPVTTEAELITLIGVSPNKAQNVSPQPKDYDFTFSVKKRVAETPLKCFVGGCSGQICSDEPGMASNCEYRESYACYKTATCERQISGKCGWTETSALTMCLENASS